MLALKKLQVCWETNAFLMREAVSALQNQTVKKSCKFSTLKSVLNLLQLVFLFLTCTELWEAAKHQNQAVNAAQGESAIVHENRKIVWLYVNIFVEYCVSKLSAWIISSNCVCEWDMYIGCVEGCEWGVWMMYMRGMWDREKQHLRTKTSKFYYETPVKHINMGQEHKCGTIDTMLDP